MTKLTICLVMLVDSSLYFLDGFSSSLAHITSTNMKLVLPRMHLLLTKLDVKLSKTSLGSGHI